MEKYDKKQIARIIQGYRKIDRDEALSSLLKRVSNCKECESMWPGRADHPFNFIVRPLPLYRLSDSDSIDKYIIRITRDDTFLRNLLEKESNSNKVIKQVKSAKFSIGLLPWLDRCMLFRKNEKTRLMIIGIDYKHFPVVLSTERDRSFPLDSYYKKSNIWGPTWKRFWVNLFKDTYDENKVNKFISDNGVYITNSMLCFGGSQLPTSHYYGYLECCRGNITEQIEIVRPEIIVSFGDYGCRNVSSILLCYNPENIFLKNLSISGLKTMKDLTSSDPIFKKGIKVEYKGAPLKFWPLYQPARSHLNWYDGDYAALRRLLGIVGIGVNASFDT